MECAFYIEWLNLWRMSCVCNVHFEVREDQIEDSRGFAVTGLVLFATLQAFWGECMPDQLAFAFQKNVRQITIPLRSVSATGTATASMLYDKASLEVNTGHVFDGFKVSVGDKVPPRRELPKLRVTPMLNCFNLHRMVGYHRICCEGG